MCEDGAVPDKATKVVYATFDKETIENVLVIDMP